ncbi:MAG: kinase [Candidatus Omnitrophica bacterium CG11_big_fil_rev_8_21_14_0_20_63_9]|nr:MAG: kinase [Candidatus Omnitrophica bacterium CG11_big_fil_rev_8_21_14_0_20_63_9]
MIISRTPFRISFFGGGTDYPVWFREHGGAVLATTIDKYCYITCRYLPPFFQHRSRLVYSKVETVMSNDQIEHPAVRGVLEHLRISDGLEIHHDGDLPARTGLGSSSAFTVGFLHALYGLNGRMPTKLQLANDAIHVEQQVLKESVGSQDQIIASFGGFNRIDFSADRRFQVSPVIVSEDQRVHLQEHLMLFFTGFSRTASEIASEQIQATPSKAQELRLMQQMVDEAISILQGGDDLDAFGRLLHEGWQVKRSLTNRISTPQIDALYETACAAGAIGGKLLGAGGGGFLLLFVRPQEQDRVKEALRGVLHVPFRFETSGSRIIFYESEGARDAMPLDRDEVRHNVPVSR